MLSVISFPEELNENLSVVVIDEDDLLPCTESKGRFAERYRQRWPHQ